MLKTATTLALLLAATTTLAQSTQPAGAKEPLPLPEVNNARLTELAAQIVLLHDVPGLSISIVDRSGLYAFGAAGVRRAGAPDRLTTEDVFHLGACGKAMTAVLLARLHDAGKLSLTKPLSELLPKNEFADNFQPITLLDLLRHRSGLPGSTDREQLPFLRAGAKDPRASRANLAQRILSTAPAGNKTRFDYADTNYALAAYVAETLTNISFEQLMRDELFTPLDMTTAGFGAPKGPNPNSQPVGHRPDGLGGALPADPGPYADLPAGFAPAGTIHCSPRDWARFSALLLGGGKKDFLKPETLTLLITPPADAKPNDPDHPPYAAGLSVTSTAVAGAAHTTYSHTGSNTLWFAQFHLFPNAGTTAGGGWGLLISTNQGGPNAEKALDEVTKEILSLAR